MNVANILPPAWPAAFAPHGPRIGLGLDIATTTNKKSNPSALAVVQQIGLSYYARLVLRLKTGDPAVLRTLISLILSGLPHGLRARRLCVDATNERFFAVDLRRALAGTLPVDLIVSSENTDYGGETMSWKDYLGNLLINTCEDGYLGLPPEKWLEIDLRQVTRERGTFQADVIEDGGHADCFDGIKLALHSLVAKGGPVQAHAAGPGNFGTAVAPRRSLKNPYASAFEHRQAHTNA